MFIFKSVGHFFANAIQKLLAAEPKVVAAATAVEGEATTVEAVTALIPTYGPLAVTVENAGFALLGEVIAVLKAGGAAAAAKFADIGLDSTVIETVQAVAASPAIVAAGKLL
jgi:hypothetical protein